MASSISAAQLSDFLKRVYPSEADNTIVKAAILYNNTDLGEFDQVGGSLVIPVIVQGEQGVTYGAPSSTATTRGAIALNIVNATVNPPMISVKSALPADTVQRAQKNDTSLGPATKLRFQAQKDSLIRRVEQSFLYGGDAGGFAAINGTPAVAGSTATMVLSNYSQPWFSTLVGAELDVYNAAGGTRRTATTPMVVTGFNMATNTLSVSGTNADLASIVSTDVIWGYGAKGVEPVGLLTQLSFRGDVGFGINNTTFPTFQGQVFAVSGTLTYAQCAAAVALAQNYMPSDELTLFVSPRNFSVLVREQQGNNVKYVESGKDKTLGFTGLDISQGGAKATIVAHPFMKDQDAMVIPLPQVTLAGISKEVFDTTDAGDLVVWDHTTLSYIYSMIASLQPILLKPNQGVRLTGITPA